MNRIIRSLSVCETTTRKHANLARPFLGAVITALALTLPALAACAEGDQFQPLFDRAAISESIDALVAATDMYQASEPARIGRTPEGYVWFFGAPPDAHAQFGDAFRRSPAEAKALGVLTHYAAAFGIYSSNSAFRVKSVVNESAGTHVRMQQTYAGIPVLGGEAVVHFDPAGNLSSISSSIMVNTASLDSGETPLKPAVSASVAETAAGHRMEPALRDAVAAESTALSSSTAFSATSDVTASQDALATASLRSTKAPELMIYDPRLLGAEGAPRVAWAVDVESDPSDLVNERVFVDAQTGDTPLTYSLTHYARNRQIWNANLGGTTAAPPSVLARTETQGPIGNADVDNNHLAMGKAYDYFFTNHGLDSFDGAGTAISSYVNWSATPISGWNSTNGYFYFGSSNYAQAVDIVGHEYTHAVTAHRSGLLTTGEPGAINEALSDVWGEFIDWSAGAPGANMWLIGQSLTGGAIRDMANPPAHNQPSTTDSALFYRGTDQSLFATTNSGVCNKLFQLLTDGTPSEPFNEYTITGLGEANVRNLLWRCQATSQFTSSATFQALYAALGQAAIDLGFNTDQRDTVEMACRAVGINCDLSSPPSSQKALDDVNVWTGVITATGEGYHGGKAIPYKVYVPKYGLDVGGDTAGRGTTQWPLDVIILSHGAGMNRSVASGYGGTDGLAMYWARKGYIVVCPTHRKLRSITIAGSTYYWWEFYNDDDNILRFAGDMIHHATSALSGEFYAHRILDLKFLRDNLSSILNAGSLNGCYNATTSKVALAGHSLGAYTVMLAAGVELRDGGNQVIDLTQYHGLRRQNQPDSNVAHDSGPFVRDIAAYLAISGGTYTGDSTLTVIDPNRPNLTGKDLMQQPFMLMSGTNDVLTNTNGQLYALSGGTACYHDAVLKPFGVCPSPAYAVIMDGANHITPVSGFTPWPSSHFGDLWIGWTDWANRVSAFFNGSEAPANEKAAFGQAIIDWLTVAFHAFPSTQTTPGQETARLGEFEHYSLAFLDSYLSPRYDTRTSADLGSRFLGKTEAEHEAFLYIADNIGFRYSSPTHAFFVKNSAGTPLVQFQSDGNLLVLQGSVSAQQSSLSDDTTVKELLVKNSVGTVEAKVSGVTGNLSVRGNVTTQVSTLVPSSTPELVINDSSGVAQIILDASGNLKTRNKIHVVGGTYP